MTAKKDKVLSKSELFYVDVQFLIRFSLIYHLIKRVKYKLTDCLRKSIGFASQEGKTSSHYIIQDFRWNVTDSIKTIKTSPSHIAYECPIFEISQSRT